MMRISHVDTHKNHNHKTLLHIFGCKRGYFLTRFYCVYELTFKKWVVMTNDLVSFHFDHSLSH